MKLDKLDIMHFIKEYWFLITFCTSTIISLYKIVKTQNEATRCSLRNDILEIYDRCKEKKQITHYELESILHSAELYFKLNGNTFVKDVVNRVKQFELID